MIPMGDFIKQNNRLIFAAALSAALAKARILYHLGRVQKAVALRE